MSESLIFTSVLISMGAYIATGFLFLSYTLGSQKPKMALARIRSRRGP